MTDFHAHVLPRMDDGSKSLEESKELLISTCAQGIDVICATPHFDSNIESADSFLKRRAAAHTALSESCAGLQIPRLVLGAEVSFFVGMSGNDELSSLCIGGSRCLLIEMPYFTWTAGIRTEIYSLSTNLSLIPILAHIERYPEFSSDDKLADLFEIGALLQINAEAFAFTRTRKRALELFKSGLCVLGSDCHGIKRRPQNMGAAAAVIEKDLGAKRSADIFSRCDELLGT